MAKERLSREARRNKILEAATEVFGRVGFEFTRMDDVAKAAGIAKGLLYKHFSSKDDLFEALIDRQGRAYADELRGALQNSDVEGNPLGALQAGLGFWLRTVTQDHATFNFTDPGSHNAYDGLRSSLRQVIAESIQTADPNVGDTHAHLIAALIQGSAENLGLAWRDDPGSVTQDEALEMLANFCWGGLMQLQGSNAAELGRADSLSPRARAGSG